MYDNLFDNYYQKQALTGYGIEPTFHKGAIFQRGHGSFGSVFKSILNAAKPLVKSAGKYAARTALETAGNIGSDLIEGKNFQESASANARQAFEDLKGDVGGFVKRKLSYKRGKKRPNVVVKRQSPRKKRSKASRFL